MASGTGDTAALRLPAPTGEDIGVTALTSHVIPRRRARACPRSRTIQSIIAIWGALTLHFPHLLSMARLLVAARPRPSMLGELLKCQGQQDITTILRDPTKSTKLHRYTQKCMQRRAACSGQLWSAHCSQRIIEPTNCTAPTRLHNNDFPDHARHRDVQCSRLVYYAPCSIVWRRRSKLCRLVKSVF